MHLNNLPVKEFIKEFRIACLPECEYTAMFDDAVERFRAHRQISAGNFDDRRGGVRFCRYLVRGELDGVQNWRMESAC